MEEALEPVEEKKSQTSSQLFLEAANEGYKTAVTLVNLVMMRMPYDKKAIIIFSMHRS